MRFAIYQDSHVGGRASNQDRMGYCFTREALLLLLADGMGGHQNGEIAAALTLQTMGALFRERATPDINDPPAMLDELIYAAHQSLLGYRATHRLPDTPRTTIVACLIQHGQAWWAHCGDSRLYWLRGGRILSRTVDHSHIERLIALGRVSPHERANHPERNKLYNCVGAPRCHRSTKQHRCGCSPVISCCCVPMVCGRACASMNWRIACRWRRLSNQYPSWCGRRRRSAAKPAIMSPRWL